MTNEELLDELIAAVKLYENYDIIWSERYVYNFDKFKQEWSDAAKNLTDIRLKILALMK